MSEKLVKTGIVGLGNMGTAHARSIIDGRVKGLELTAVCDADEGRLAGFKEQQKFTDPAAMYASGAVEAVVVATPHFFHPEQAGGALKAGLHVMVEKPVAVHKQAAEELNAVPRAEGQVFAAMFNQRTDPHYRKLREMIVAGEFGAIRRVVWVITNWFRTEAYYRSGGWRATWKGEGGGVLLNQCPHQLDLWQWLFGMPQSIRAFCDLGRYHEIEVEDDVTAYMEYADGCKGLFVTTTGEAPGSNRLEITAERGKVVCEADGKISWERNEVEMSHFSKTDPGSFSRPATWDITIPVNGRGSQHVEILTNFAEAIREGKELIAPATDGVRSVELANAMLYSSLTESTVKMPLDGAAYAAKLEELMAGSKEKMQVDESGPASDFAKSNQ